MTAEWRSCFGLTEYVQLTTFGRETTPFSEVDLGALCEEKHSRLARNIRFTIDNKSNNLKQKKSLIHQKESTLLFNSGESDAGLRDEQGVIRNCVDSFAGQPINTEAI